MLIAVVTLAKHLVYGKMRAIVGIVRESCDSIDRPRGKFEMRDFSISDFNDETVFDVLQNRNIVIHRAPVWRKTLKVSYFMHKV